MIKILEEDLEILQEYLDRFSKLTISTIQATREWIDDDSFIIDTRKGQLEWLREYMEMRITILLELIDYLNRQIRIESTQKKFVITQLLQIYVYELKCCEENLLLIINKLAHFS